MTVNKTMIVLLAGFMAVLLLGSTAARADRMSELQEKFKQRFPEIRSLKQAGKVGETYTGMIEAVQNNLDSGGQKLVQEENADRTELYALIAKNENTTPELVAEHNAARNFQKAKAGEYLKDKDGAWKKKS